MSLTASPGTGSPAADELHPLRIVLVNPHCIFRQALRVLFDGQRQFAVAGEAGRADEALELTAALLPDVVLTDLDLPDGDGMRFIGQLRARFPQLRILVLTAVRTRGAAAAVKRAGAAGYLLKDCDRGELLTALREIGAGRWYCSVVPAAAHAATQASYGSHLGTQAAHLTERQQQVLRAVALGHSSREIALMLGVSVRAVHAHRARLRDALQLNGTAALTRFAASHGFTPPAPPSP
jgi:two-component system, NarL family, nitrate/nitrite response regulator NarL